MKIRRATPDDTKALVDLDRKVWSCFDGTHIWRLWTEFSTVLVASKNETILGAVVLIRTDQKNLTLLHKIFVNPCAQKHGIGRALMAEATKNLDNRNQDCLLTTGRKDLLAFYGGYGFLLKKTEPSYYLPEKHDNGDRFVLTRQCYTPNKS